MPQLPVYCATQIAQTSLRFISAQKPLSSIIPSCGGLDFEWSIKTAEDVEAFPRAVCEEESSTSTSSCWLSGFQGFDEDGGSVLIGYQRGSHNRAEAENR